MAYLWSEFCRLYFEAAAEMFEAGRRDAGFVSRTVEKAVEYKYRNR